MDTGSLERLPQPVSLRAQAEKAIRNAVVRGTLRPGQRVPEGDLAESLGISRTPVREALRVLEYQGLLESRPKSGTYVRTVDRASIENGLKVRACLEGLAARTIVLELSEAAKTELQERLSALHQQMMAAGEAGEAADATELDIEWHTVFVEATGNQPLVQAWQDVGATALIWTPERHLYPLSPEELTASMHRHAPVLEALVGGDPDAAAAAAEGHVLVKLDDLDAYYEDQEVEAGSAS